MKEKTDIILNKILIIAFFFFIISLTVFVLANFFKPSSLYGLKINFSGVNEVRSLEDYNYEVLVENNSNKKLLNVNLKINLSNGAFFADKIEEKEMSFFINEINPRSKHEQELKLFFINQGGLEENIKITLTYKLENKNYLFEKEERFSVFTKNSPIKVQIFTPNKIYVNQQFQSSLRVINLTNKKLSNIKVVVEPPSYFNLFNQFPQGDNFAWQFLSLNPHETKEISFIGQIQNIKSNSLLTVKVDFSFENFSYSLEKEIAKINLKENPIILSLVSKPENKAVPVGSTIFYEITIKNNSQTILEDNEVKIIIGDNLDLSSVNSDGYYSALEGAIYWKPRNKPELLKLKPNDQVKIGFSVSLYNSYPILGQENKNFTTKVRVEFQTPTIPPEIETMAREYTIFQEDEKKIIGNIEVSHELRYYDNDIENSGPFPLINEIPTTLTWHIKIKTIGEDFKNFTISGKFPEAVNLTGKVANDTVTDNLKFDTKTGNFFYSISDLPANLGYFDKSIDLTFQIVVAAPSNVDINSADIIPYLSYSAQTSFSQVQLNGTLYPIKGTDIL